MRHLIAALILAAATPAAAQDAQGEAVITPYDGSFDDATFSLEAAIVNRGLVVDHVSHVGEMLQRTAADVGADTRIFENADVYLFCSAVLSREVMEADPMNIVHCPYNIFVAETGDGVVVGHRSYPDGPMKKVEAMLDEIVAEAVGG